MGINRTAETRRLEHLLVALVLAFGAALVGFGFTLDLIVPLEPAVVIFGALSVWGIFNQSVTRLSLLPRFMVLLYSVCFSVTIGHLFAPDYLWWRTPAAIALIRDEYVSADMMSVGTVGLLGFLAGIRLVQAFSTLPQPQVLRRTPTLGPAATVFAACSAVLLSWVVAPKATIFTAAYNTGGAAIVAAPMNFNAAWLLSYVLIVLMFIDLEREPSATLRSFKRWWIAGAVAFIVIFLQVLRGDRECAGLLISLAFLYVTGTQSSRLLQRSSDLWRKMTRVAVPAVIVVVVFLVLGAVRVSLASAEKRQGLSLGESLQNTFQENTWSSILLTNLAQAGQFRNHTAQYLYGETYLDYLKSLPPGILTRAIGIERPLEADRGPNWWFRGISAGGIHAVVIPYRNFGMAGAFLVLLAAGTFIGWVEIRNDSAVFWTRLLYGATAVGSFFWFWYGDMTMIRALMSAAVVGPAYALWLHVNAELAQAPRAVTATP
jgi:hypothetical protein